MPLLLLLLLLLVVVVVVLTKTLLKNHKLLKVDASSLRVFHVSRGFIRWFQAMDGLEWYISIGMPLISSTPRAPGRHLWLESCRVLHHKIDSSQGSHYWKRDHFQEERIGNFQSSFLRRAVKCSGVVAPETTFWIGRWAYFLGNFHLLTGAMLRNSGGASAWILSLDSFGWNFGWLQVIRYPTNLLRGWKITETYVFKINGLFWFWKKVGLGLHNPQTKAIYTWYISDIYSQLGDYMLPTTFYKNLKNLLTRCLHSTAVGPRFQKLLILKFPPKSTRKRSPFSRASCPKVMAPWRVSQIKHRDLKVPDSTWVSGMLGREKPEEGLGKVFLMNHEVKWTINITYHQQ